MGYFGAYCIRLWGACGEMLGPRELCRRFGRKMGPKVEAKIDKKINKKVNLNLSVFCLSFEDHAEAILERKWYQHHYKNKPEN